MNVPADEMRQNRPLRFRKILTWLLVGVVIALTAATVHGQSFSTGQQSDDPPPVWAGAEAADPPARRPSDEDDSAAAAAPLAGAAPAAEASEAASAAPAAATSAEAGPALSSDGLTGDQVASVNGQPVARGVLVAKLLQYYGQRALDSIIQQMVIIQEAERLGLSASGAEIAEALEDFYRTGAFPETMPMGERRRTWDGLLKGRGLTLDDFREDLRVEILLRKLAERRVNVTAAMVRAKYDELFGERLMLSWILVSTEAEAREVSRRLASGTEFETLARQVSSDVGSAAQGGRLARPVTRGERGSAFDAAVFSLKVGEVSLPQRVGQGWAVVRLDERIAADDVPLEEVEDRLRAAVAEEAQASMRPVVLQELLRKARIIRGPLMPADTLDR